MGLPPANAVSSRPWANTSPWPLTRPNSTPNCKAPTTKSARRSRPSCNRSSLAPSANAPAALHKTFTTRSTTCTHVSARTHMLGRDKNPSHVVLEVIDTGVGMDEETRKHCLEPFFSTKGQLGTGLGLAMVYGVIQRHDGGIEIDSAPGKGTKMRLIFPVREAADFALIED